MSRHVDYEALLTKLQATDVFMAIKDDEPALIAECMDCETTILRAIGAEVNASTLHEAILEHDCSAPSDTVVIDELAELVPILEGITFERAEPPAESPEPVAAPAAAAPPTRVLHLTDRCDRCLAQAWVRIETKAGEILLCSHHFAQAEMTVTAAGYPVVDERAYINVKPGA